MKLRVASGTLVLASLLSVAAHAGPSGDAMAQCLVSSTSASDRTLLIQWIFAALASHPDVRALSNVSPEKGDELNSKVADLFVTLMTQRCKAETADAIKSEGPAAMSQSFKLLGQVAMQGIAADPAVAGFLAGLQKHIDPKAIEQALAPKQ